MLHAKGNPGAPGTEIILYPGLLSPSRATPIRESHRLTGTEGVAESI